MLKNAPAHRRCAGAFFTEGELFFFLLVFLSVDHDVGQDAEDEGAGDLCDGHGAEADGESADTGDEDDRYYEEVAVVAEVNGLYHLETGHCDEAVKRDAHTAHYAGRNCRKEGREGSDEGGKHAEHRGGNYRYDRGVARDGDAADRFTVGGVGAASEDGADHGAHAVTEKGVGKSGILEQVVLDDGGEVLVVRDVFGKDHEGDGDVCHGNRAYVSGVNVGKALERLYEGEAGDPLHAFEEREVDDLEGVDACDIADDGEYRGYRVSGYDADDEGDHLKELLAVYRADDGHAEGDESAKDGKVGRSDRDRLDGDGALVKIAYGVARERETDDRNGGTDNDGGHDLIYPCDTAELDDDGDNDVHKTCERRADDESGISGSGCGCAGKGCCH